MKDQNVFTLINQQDGNLAFKLFTFTDNSHFDHLQRNNFYSVIWIKEGDGLLKVDLTKWPVLMGYMERVKSRPAVQATMNAEGLM